jgi:hypothetical protein
MELCYELLGSGRRSRSNSAYASCRSKSSNKKLHPYFSSPHKMPQTLHCPNPLPTLHGTETDAAIQTKYLKEASGVLRFYNWMLAPGTLQDDPLDNMTILPEDGDFIMWGGPDTEAGDMEMSAYNTQKEVIGTKGSFDFIPKRENTKDLDNVRFDHILELQGDHAVFVTFHTVFAHFLLDYLPFISYMRDTLPQRTRFVLYDAFNTTRTYLEQLDPAFANDRVDWLECQHRPCRAHARMLRVRQGSLTVMHPKSPVHHMDHVVRARRWIVESHPPKRCSLQHRTVVYYTRNHGSAQHGRAMDRDQEQTMIQMIRHGLERYGRPETLVVFDGTQSLEESIDIFQSANFVIGAHGGGLANLIFLLPSHTCGARPKVLEFLVSPLTPLVQDGGMGRTYYNMYSSCPWVDYHHVFYVPPSNGDVTFINMVEFQEALQSLFQPLSQSSSSQPQPLQDELLE